ncbi:hypothetical protein JCM8547_006545 [Rhodosporidiobolus lusitaniae]
MDTHIPAHFQTSARLLRVGHPRRHPRPGQGREGERNAIRGLGVFPLEEVRQRLDTAIESLSSAHDGLSYENCLPLITALSVAAELAAAPPYPPSPSPSPSPFSLLPAELVARIVHFCQSDDLRLRHNTNGFTSSRLVSSKTVAARVEEDDEFKKSIQFLSTDLVEEDLDWAEDVRFDSPGRLLLPLLRNLGRRKQIKSLHLHFRFKAIPADGKRDFLGVLGTHAHDWSDLLKDGLPSVEDLRSPVPPFSGLSEPPFEFLFAKHPVTLFLRDLDTDLPALATLFTSVGPSLRHLAVRIKATRDVASPDLISNALNEALKQCVKLETLECGGVINATVFDGLQQALPRLRRLTVLPIRNENHSALDLTLTGSSSLPSHVNSITLCDAFLDRTDPDWVVHRRELAEEFEKEGIELRLERREAEAEWLEWDA